MIEKSIFQLSISLAKTIEIRFAIAASKWMKRKKIK